MYLCFYQLMATLPTVVARNINYLWQSYFLDWISFAVRRFHVITAMMLIGSSLYFISLNLGLNCNVCAPANGEEW